MLDVSKAVHVVGLDEKLKLNRPLRVKYGIDPTSPHVHLGHTVPLRLLKQFQDAGHQVVLIIGDFTATLGDPTGRDEVRASLLPMTVVENTESYLSQIGKVIDINKAEIHRNGDWFYNQEFGLKDLISLCSRFSVQQMIERDDFTNRIKARTPVYMHELMYPILQAYDSCEVRADVELGGTEQLYTLMLARDMQKDHHQEPQACITMPILRGLDGVKRMGKSLGNFISLNDPPFEMFSKVMSIPDELLEEWYGLLTSLNGKNVISDVGPFEAKKSLGCIITEWLHGFGAHLLAEREWTHQFSERKEPTDLPEVKIVGPQTILNIMMICGFAESKNKARTLIIQGGVRYNGAKVTDPLAIFNPIEDIVKVGRRYARLKS